MDSRITQMFFRINQHFDGKRTDDEILYRAEISRKQLREVLHHYEEYVSTAISRITCYLPLHSCKRSSILHNAMGCYLITLQNHRWRCGDGSILDMELLHRAICSVCPSARLPCKFVDVLIPHAYNGYSPPMRSGL